MKTKRFLAIALSIISLVSLIVVPTTSVSALQGALIDPPKTGTVTIHKYEMEDLSTATHKMTGMSSDGTYVPSNATPLDGVTFRLTRVKNITDAYFTTEGNALPTVAQAKTLAALGTYTQVTGKGSFATGTATFSNLPLGIYLVQEVTDAAGSPGHVKQPVEDFVISVPMTNTAGTAWNYTLDLYPKNKVNYTNISIKKVDHNNTATGLAGAKFKLERNVYNYDTSAWAYQTQQDNITTGSDGTIAVNHIPCGYQYRLTETAASSGYIFDGTSNTMTFTLNVDGAVTAQSGSLGTMNTTSKVITVHNSKPSISKYIDKSKGANTSLVSQTTVAHTSTTDYNYYTLLVKTPNVYMKNLSTFYITDVVNGSTTAPTVTKVVEKSTGTTVAEGATGWSQSSTAVSGNSSAYSLKIDFSTADNTTIKKDTEYYVSIRTFTRTLNANTTNKATITYSNTTAGTTTSTIESNTTTLRVGAYQFKKVNQDNNPLQGFQYKIYPTLADAQAGTNAISAATNSSGTNYSTTFTSDANGLVSIYFLNYGDSVTGSKDYWIVETKTKVPASGDADQTAYNLLKEPFKITVNNASYQFSGTNKVVKNVPISDMPLTGGTGFALCIGVGSMFVLASILIMAVRKKKQTN